MNAASKFTKSEGEEEQLGGTVYTKNLKEGMKMPQKIIEGRNNWLLMEKDPEYEEEDMGDNCESNFEHCNKMATVEMPRDFLAKLTQYFLTNEGQEFSFFQEAHREASEIMYGRRPHWRKRKAKSASLYISIFFLIKKEIDESDDALAKELFVEALSSRDDYIDLVMKALDRVDEIEAKMAEGKAMKLPGWTMDEDENTGVEEPESKEVDIDQIVLDTMEMVGELDKVEITKYVKIFKKDGLAVAIQHTKVKKLAKQKGLPYPNFQSQKRNYPSFVSLKTETFTKPTATSSKGGENTVSGFCTSIPVNRLSNEARSIVQEAFDLEDDSLLMEVDEEEEMNPAASQDFPMFSQSQSSETLKVCDLCDFKTRNKQELLIHTNTHPKCVVCKKSFVNEELLNVHLQTHSSVKCQTCNVEILKTDLSNHMENHNLSANYRKGLSKSKKSKATPTGSTQNPPKLNSFIVFCRAFREEKKRLFPQMNMLEINKLLRDDWAKLSPDQKATYKITQPSTEVTLDALPAIASTLSDSSTPIPPEVPSLDFPAGASPPTTNGPAIIPLNIASDVLPATISVNEIGSSFSVPPQELEVESPTTNSSKESASASASDSIPLVNAASSIDPPAADVGHLDEAIDNVEETLVVQNRRRTSNYTQSKIKKCGTCGRMFYGEDTFKDHIEKEHPDCLEPRKNLYWIKVKKVWWPCKSVGESEELLKVEIYDDKKTMENVDVSKLKEFTLLPSIAKSRTQEWRRGYAKAVDEFESS